MKPREMSCMRRSPSCPRGTDASNEQIWFRIGSGRAKERYFFRQASDDLGRLSPDNAGVDTVGDNLPLIGHDELAGVLLLDHGVSFGPVDVLTDLQLPGSQGEHTVLKLNLGLHRL